MNKRQKKKLFKKKSIFYPKGGPDVFMFQIFTGIGMTKKKWENFNQIMRKKWYKNGNQKNRRNRRIL